MDRRTVSLDDGSLRFRYFGKFQCGIAVFYYLLCGFVVFGPSLRPPLITAARETKHLLAGKLEAAKNIRKTTL